MDQASEAVISSDHGSASPESAASFERPGPEICSWQAARDVAVCNFQPQHAFLVGIDSDGCVFDTMELKHKECVIPNLIRCYELQGISKYAREVAEFVNLYSKSRGVNRFPALIETLSWLQRRPDVTARGVRVQVPQALTEWLENESTPCNPALEAAWAASGDSELKRALEWSEAVNEAIAGLVHGVPPFPYVRQTLDKLLPLADLLVVSANPKEILDNEWEEHRLAGYVQAICGQETGTKKDILANACKYPAGHTLMIGDALHDYWAALANGALFFPINPGAEEASWRRLFDEGIDRFRSGTFGGAYQEKLLEEFDRRLPAQPPWPASDDLPGP
jgi:phosphoglycolate phosphatase-like HAD superfamily hydrolase